MIDDFHNISTIKQPTGRALSKADHFVTSMVNTPSAPAVGKVTLSRMHQCIIQDTNRGSTTVIGGICPTKMEEIMITAMSEQKCSSLEFLPSDLTDISADGWNQKMKSYAVYNTKDHPVESSSLKSCGLVDEYVGNLKSMADYAKAFDDLVERTPMGAYLDEFVTPFVADWPGWFNAKRLVAASRIPPTIIPQQGPFHVYINILEDHVMLSRFLYAPMFDFIFGVVFPPKPKLFRCELVLAAAFLGWKKIRQQIIQKFSICKDPEYLCLINTLEEVLPLVILHYNVIFKSGNMEMYRATMRRLSLIFIIWKRHHYDKSTLSWLSDDLFHQQFFPEYDRRLSIWNVLVTDLLPELFHARLRRHIESHYDAHTVQQRARMLAAMHSAGDQFLQHFGDTHITSSLSKKDFRVIEAKAASFLIQIFDRVSQNMGTASISTRQDGHILSVHLPSLQTEVDVRSMPAAFTFAHVLPEDGVACDSGFCDVVSNQESVLRMSCGHTYHRRCQKRMSSKCCERCLPGVQRRVKELVKSFNTSLLVTSDRLTADKDPSREDRHGGLDEEVVEVIPTEADKYLSPEFETMMEEQLKNIQYTPSTSSAQRGISTGSTVRSSNLTPSTSITPFSFVASPRRSPRFIKSTALKKIATNTTNDIPSTSSAQKGISTGSTVRASILSPSTSTAQFSFVASPRRSPRFTKSAALNKTATKATPDTLTKSPEKEKSSSPSSTFREGSATRFLRKMANLGNSSDGSFEIKRCEVGNITMFTFPSTFSQSTIGGRQGSNACTLIGVIFAKYHYLLGLDKTFDDEVAASALKIAMTNGNHKHDTVYQGQAVNLTVDESIVLMKLKASIDTDQAAVNTHNTEGIEDDQALLPWYLQKLSATSKEASFFMRGHATISILPINNDKLQLVDTHLHHDGTIGAVILLAGKENIQELIDCFEEVSNQRHTHMGTITVIRFEG